MYGFTCKYVIYVYGLPTCMFVYYVAWCLKRTEEGIGYPGTEVTEGCELRNVDIRN